MDVTSHHHAGSLDLVSLSESSVSSMRVPEILAPAGGIEQFFAALNSGADAVYLGLKSFNARSRAENFSVEDLRSLVPLAHQFKMKVLVTLNILIKDQELSDIVEVLTSLQDLAVDAVIVQDLGLARIIKENFPGLRLHASTQLAVHNLAGVREAYALGFKRVVLARELTAEEVKRIVRGVEDEGVELEVFCHGSLCYSYSGLCFFSGAQDARSGNRGECAYTCREPYKVVSEPGHGFLFSMRDLDTSKILDRLVQAGVHTLKIEGRKKDAKYVSSVVKLYRTQLDKIFGSSTLRSEAPRGAHEFRDMEADIRKDLQLSFQRQTTSFFVEGRYHENVIDLSHPTHLGIPVGEVLQVQDHFVTVALTEDVEKFDGLKIIPPSKLFHAAPQDGVLLRDGLEKLERRYENQEISFSLRDMYLKGRPLYEATKGMIIEIELPNGCDLPQVKDRVYKARSDALRRKVESLTNVPPDVKIRDLRPLEVHIELLELDDGSCLLAVKGFWQGRLIREASLLLQNPELRKSGSLEEDLKDQFQVFGDQGVYASELVCNISKNLFVPRSQIKSLKKQFEVDLNQNLEDLNLDLAESASKYLEQSTVARTGVADPFYQIKIDRIEYLPWIEEDVQRGLPVSEVIFEPKKMFLPDVNVESFLHPLLEFKARTKIKVRLAFPTVIRAWDEPVLKRWFKVCLDSGLESYEVGNLGALGLLNDWGLPRHDLTTDFTLYSMNREASAQLGQLGFQKVAMSIENDSEDLSSQFRHWKSAASPQVILYKDTPLFIAEACSLTALHNGCPTNKVCGYRTLEVENSKKERFLVAHEGCKSIVYGKTAFSISGARRELMALGVQDFKIDFLTRPYQEHEFRAILRSIQDDEKIPETHGANFYGKLK